MNNKNLFFAVVLSVSFMFFWSSFVLPKYAPKSTPPVVPAAIPAVPGKSGDVSTAWVPSAKPPAVPLTETTVSDAENRIAFSPQGGGVRSWTLNLKDKKVDLVMKPDEKPLPLATFPDSLFRIQQQGKQTVMQTTLPNQVRFTKRFTLSDVGYLHNLTYQFENLTPQAVTISDFEWGWGPGVGTTAAEQKENSSMIRALTKGKITAQRHKKPGEYEFGQWVAIDNRYFLIAFLPVSTMPTGAATEPKLNVIGKDEHTRIGVRQNITVPARGKVTLEYQVYAGPKGYTHLDQYKKGLEATVDFGFFNALGKLVLRSVYWLQSKTHNYGWAIVILTVVLQIILLPLTRKSFRASMAMKELQPQVAALQKNYKSDPKRLNIEMMNLYKKAGTNPFSGCLPMLLQMPIFLALFNTLRNAYELQGAPFVGWIKDLSVADPYHVLPVLMGLGMLVQTRMAGAVSDPMQKQMMYMMPIIMTVMFWSFPAGLVLYWFTQSLITMAIQFVMLNSHHKKSRKPTFELVK